MMREAGKTKYMKPVGQDLMYNNYPINTEAFKN